jgi:hypothetical protein
MAFRIGQKVVYVSREKIPGENIIRGGFGKLQIGRVYTIREIDDLYLPYYNMVGIRLEERILPLVRWEGADFEPATLAIRFRPVQSTDTGMAILEQIRRDVSNKTALPIREDEQA